jgi:hypothetical protein
LGPLPFLLYISNLPKVINEETIPILFSDDTNLLVKNLNYDDLRQKINTALHYINEWVKVNQLSINVNKTHYIQFTASNNNPLTEIQIACDKKKLRHYLTLNFLEFILIIK